MILDLVLPVLAQLPKPGISPARNKMRVGNIKYIPQPFSWSGIINQGNALCAPVDPSSHLLIPYFQFCTGCSLWPLGMDQQTVRKVIPV